MLVIAYQDEVGGLYIRPPVEGEQRNRNWLEPESSAGMYEDVDPWTYVTPQPRVFTVFPGDILQFLTGGRLLFTPHKVRLNAQDRYAMAYFHEPNFNATVRPITGPVDDHEYIHYGTHFTNMFLRCYPQRITTRRIEAEDRMSILHALQRQSNVPRLTTEGPPSGSPPAHRVRLRKEGSLSMLVSATFCNHSSHLICKTSHSRRQRRIRAVPSPVASDDHDDDIVHGLAAEGASRSPGLLTWWRWRAVAPRSPWGPGRPFFGTPASCLLPLSRRRAGGALVSARRRTRHEPRTTLGRGR